MKGEAARSLKEGCEYTRDELLPFLKYYCNLYAIEEALKEEQNISQKIPIVSDTQEARCEYQRDLAAFIEEVGKRCHRGAYFRRCRISRTTKRQKRKKAYREQVMQEIETEAKQYGMTVEEYARNGYEPSVTKR